MLRFIVKTLYYSLAFVIIITLLTLSFAVPVGIIMIVMLLFSALFGI